MNFREKLDMVVWLELGGGERIGTVAESAAFIPIF